MVCMAPQPKWHPGRSRQVEAIRPPTRSISTIYKSLKSFACLDQRHLVIPLSATSKELCSGEIRA